MITERLPKGHRFCTHHHQCTARTSQKVASCACPPRAGPPAVTVSPAPLATAPRRIAVAAVTAGLATTGIAGGATASAQTFPGLSSTATELVSQTVQGPATTVRPAEGTFTSGFGPRWGTMHNGIDIANAIGTPILTVMNGTVIDSGPTSGYGQWIRIKHDDGSVSVYGHMASLYVSVGERVAAGQTIAGMGNLGFSTGSHLHFEIHPDGATPVDPVPWFNARGIYF
ncbi:M23 family metallopeptidase [Corynebacterium suedekumii]|nr:M23 family metallopeptidase [Corynebacterium suedekumii]